MTSSQPSDIELVTVYYIRNEYETKYKQNVPMALKYLTIQFSNRIIGCKLLTLKQDMEFFKLLNTKLPSIRRFNLLFRASDHKYLAKKFHEYCDNKGGTITIIKSNEGNIFGGYTSKSWASEYIWIRDENAFLFLIKSDDGSIENKCPLLLELKKGKANCAIHHSLAHGPVFGAGIDIRIQDRCNKKIGKKPCFVTDNYSCLHSYGNHKNDIRNICGGNVKDEYDVYSFFQVDDYQVFQIIND